MTKDVCSQRGCEFSPVYIVSREVSPAMLDYFGPTMQRGDRLQWWTCPVHLQGYLAQPGVTLDGLIETEDSGE